MSLITRCPACDTLFKVVPDQLRISNGWVRCGRCHEVFEATQHLLPPEPTLITSAPAPLAPVTPTPPAQPPFTPPRPETVVFESPLPGPDPSPAPVAAPEPFLIASAPVPLMPPSPPPAPVPPAPPTRRSFLPFMRQKVAVPAPPPNPWANSGFHVWHQSWMPEDATPSQPPRMELDDPLNEMQEEHLHTPVDTLAPAPADTGHVAAVPAANANQAGAGAAHANPDDANAIAPPAAAHAAPRATPSLIEKIIRKAAAPGAPPPGSIDQAPPPGPGRSANGSNPVPDAGQPSDLSDLPAFAASQPAAEAAAPATASPQQQATPSFVKHARRRALWACPPVRAALWALALGLLLALGLQVALYHRDRLAAQDPRLAPALQQLCTVLGCQVRPYRHIESVRIDSSAVKRAGGQSLQFQAIVQNTANFMLAPPSLELTLTTAQGQTLVRRVLSPQEMGAPAQLHPHSELPVNLLLTLDVSARPDAVADYRVLAFYP